MPNTATRTLPHTFNNSREQVVDIERDKFNDVVVSVNEQQTRDRKTGTSDGSLHSNFMELLFRLGLSLCAVIFIVLPPLAYSLDGKEVQHDQRGKTMLEWIKWGPTIFPIIFAAIVGNFLQAVALKLAQNGARLGILEQLTRTINLFTAVTTPYLIQAYNRISVILLLLWAVSPLGGQASLRLLSTQFVAFRSPTDVLFLSPTNISSYLSEGGQNYGTWRVQSNVLYTTSLLGIASSKYRPVDLWGNVRIPYIEELEKQIPQPGPDGWYDVANKNTTYSSLLGIPIRGLTQNITATVQTSYSNLNCSFLGLLNADRCETGQDDRCFNVSQPHIPEWVFPSAIAYPSEFDINEYLSVGINISQTEYLSGNESPDPLDLTIQSTGKGGWSIANCKLSQTYLDVQISCISSQCSVSKLRRLHTGTPRPPLFYRATPGLAGTFSNFVNDLSMTAKSGKQTYSNTNQGYIYNPDDPLASLADWVDIADVGVENFEVRMTQLMNTLMGAVQGPALFFNNFDIQNNTFSERLGRVVAADSSVGDSVNLKELFVCDKVWAAVTLFAAVLLFVIGVSSAIIAFTTLAPDTLASLSVLAAESRYFDVVHEGSTMNRDERAIALKDRVVKLGDVEASSETGYIALGTVDTDNNVAELRIGRIYR